MDNSRIYQAELHLQQHEEAKEKTDDKIQISCRKHGKRKNELSHKQGYHQIQI